jgi:type I restriction enzyme R subunit
MNQGFANENVVSDELQSIMDDYNNLFGTAFATDNFSAYYDDINLRMKKKKPDMEPLDLLLVVGMFLTGFDAKKLNTLYVDKNLEYHGLLQAFSRTNRILNEKKRFGKIVCFRDLKENVDASIKLFSNNEPNEYIIREPFDKVKADFNILSIKFKEKYPDIACIDNLKSEYAKRDFVLAFREIIKKRAEMQIYEDFEPNDTDFVLSEQEFMDFRSKYLDIAIGNVEGDNGTPIVGEPEIPYGDDRTLDDIDFCLELLHSDVINVAYILELITDLNPLSDDYHEKRKQIIDTMIKDATMRHKAKLIDGFIRQNVDNDKENFEKSKADGSMDLESRLTDYITDARNRAVSYLAFEEDIDEQALTKFLSEYDYLQREKPEIIQEAISQKKIGFKQRRNLQKRILEKLRTIIEMFNWE